MFPTKCSGFGSLMNIDKLIEGTIKPDKLSIIKINIKDKIVVENILFSVRNSTAKSTT